MAKIKNKKFIFGILGLILIVVIVVGLLVRSKHADSVGRNEARKISVKSTAVSYANGQYRYGFTVTNDGNQAFTGSVIIVLATRNKALGGDDLILTAHDLNPGADESGSVGLQTGPMSSANPNGVAAYRYKVITSAATVSFPAAPLPAK